MDRHGRPGGQHSQHARLPPSLSAAGRTLKEALEGPERQIILDVLESHNWNRNVTADSLGINRTTLYKKMKRLGLEDPLASRSGPVSEPPGQTPCLACSFACAVPHRAPVVCLTRA